MSDSSPGCSSCPQCGAALPLEATEGLCPRCLLLQAMHSTPAPQPAPSPVVLTPEELAPFFPNYEIQRMLGRGGMGAVYLARQISLNRLVAIKILPAELDDGENNFTQRFKNEAQAMAQLSHPGIVAVFDFGETANGLLYIVMEYVAGTDVQQMVASQSRLHSAHAMAITAHVCDALAYAHSRGIIHRDIKPSNIMVSTDGVVKVADFGLAKMSQGEQAACLTQSGVTMGTLHFMAPEALTLGTAVDQRADIYAVGVMLYQMLTGKLPQGLFEMPSLQVPGLDPRYDRIVAKALREDRAVRYQQASELRRDLDAILTQPVVKVGLETDQAAAAVAPPPKKSQSPAGQFYRAAQCSAPAPPKNKSLTGLFLAGLALLAATGGFLFVSGKGGPTTELIKATKAAFFVNSLGMKFVPVPGTHVLFCIHETRYQDYAAYAAVAPEVDAFYQHQGADRFSDIDRPNEHPVIHVSWEDAQKFLAWLSKKEGRTYRLPTDREWSIAAGIGDTETWAADTTPSSVTKNTTNFPWGTQWPPPPGSGNYSDATRKARAPRDDARYLDGYDDGYATTAPVMSYPPNPFGLYDMGGNVWEFCEDWYNHLKKDRVWRGGAWDSYERDHLLTSHRWHNSPALRNSHYGFRCVVELDDQAEPNALNP